jgi:hypothetical protein
MSKEGNEFVWTDELVKELLNVISEKLSGDGTTIQIHHSAVERFKQSKQPKREVLFVTEDGVEIFLKQYKIWVVNHKWEFYWKYAEAYVNGDCKYFKIFADKEKAEEYILLNKPVLSVNDVRNVFEMHTAMDYFMQKKLIDLAKEKIKSI